MTSYKTLLLIIAVIFTVISGIYFLTHKQSEPTSGDVAVVDSKKTVRYLPLGDSYTIGQSVAQHDRWPDQLVALYRADDKMLSILANPSVTGYTTQNLIDKELPLVQKLNPDFVTVLIGVNDYVQGVSADTFAKNLDYIITQLQKQMRKPSNILLVTIPDYGKTPTGAQYGKPAESTAGIMQFNQIIKDTAAKAKLPVADIFIISQQVQQDASLTASDGLHPSGKQYKLWTTIIQQALETADLPT